MADPFPLYRSDHRITYSVGVRLSGHWSLKVDWGGCLRSILSILETVLKIVAATSPLWVPVLIVPIQG